MRELCNGIERERERERERAYLDIVVEAAVIAEPGTSGHNVGFSTDAETSGHELCEVLAQHLLAGLLWAAEILHAFEFGRRRRADLHQHILVEVHGIPEEDVGACSSHLNPSRRIVELVPIQSVHILPVLLLLLRRRRLSSTSSSSLIAAATNQALLQQEWHGNKATEKPSS
jgi:hypothetical protein